MMWPLTCGLLDVLYLSSTLGAHTSWLERGGAIGVLNGVVVPCCYELLENATRANIFLIKIVVANWCQIIEGGHGMQADSVMHIQDAVC